MSILLYGATGYVGALIVAAAQDRNIEITLGGRSESVADAARSAGLPFRVGAVDDIDLDGEAVVINAAGPFSATAAGLAARCVENGVHYLDIAGEVAEFQSVHSIHAAALDANVMLMPGVGFGVVHTDGLARHLVERLPEAVSLDIAFATSGGVSAGTLGSMTAGFGDRSNVTAADLRRRRVDFPSGSKRCVQNPWRGDLLTAAMWSDIGEITTWISVPRIIEHAMSSAHRRGSVERPPMSTRALRAIARRMPAGPSTRQLHRGSAEVWASATGPDGRAVTATLELPDAYVATVDSALDIARRVEAGDWTAGFRTPAQQYGSDHVLSLPGTVRTDR